MDEVKKIIKQILKDGYLMSLGTNDESGTWVSDVVYVHDGFDIYWISDDETRHSQAILKNPKVAATITISNNRGEDNVGLQIEGVAERLEGENYKLAVAHLKKRGKGPIKEGKPFLDEESWYHLKPTKIELIYEPKWGFNKKSLDL